MIVAEELAAHMRRYLHGEREFAVCTMPPKEWMMKREICRVLFKEKQHLGDVKRRTRAHLLLHGIKLSREYSDIFCQKAMYELEKTEDPCLLMMVSEAKSIKKRTDQQTKLIEHMFDEDKMFHLIHSIPGFGVISAAYLTSMIMDINRFPNKNALAAYFGVVPKIRDSADMHKNCATTHRGDEEIRRLVAQAAFVHANKVDESVVKDMWKRLKNKGKAHREVQIACARKLLTVVYSVVKSGKPYVANPGLLQEARSMADELVEDME